jgi:hypothetical protein
MKEDLVHRRAHRLGEPAQACAPLVAEWARATKARRGTRDSPAAKGRPPRW